MLWAGCEGVGNKETKEYAGARKVEGRGEGERRGEGILGSTHEVGSHDLVDRALVGDKGVVEHAGEADHGQAAVLDLRRLSRQRKRSESEKVENKPSKVELQHTRARAARA